MTPIALAATLAAWSACLDDALDRIPTSVPYEMAVMHAMDRCSTLEPAPGPDAMQVYADAVMRSALERGVRP